METLLANPDLVLKLGLSVIIGALIGLERELDAMPAGFRTHMLVCLGATLFTILSIAYPGGDPTRIASQIVVGIGFLGAGAIFKAEGSTRGLTTAADLWALAAIGMAIGFGEYVLALVATIVVLLMLMLKKMPFFKNFVQKHHLFQKRIEKEAPPQ
ncbi:MAG: MgtC/SapB family protein [Candidatus Diapherotrites archaeon]|uniref:MgtC/SapB family protein n=1 Tax=Candidatus Iainarchaeum sp. TaxID=3101447 RepID=A0A8T4L2S7_9ARCH|nr:MgtC/SapB family protein [Candidatus Diapherotrites archaeon]